MRLALTAFALVTLAGCSVQTTERSTPYGYGSYDDDQPRDANKAPPSDRPTLATPTPTPADDGSFSEVVYVFMRDRLNRRWFCTGTLVSQTKVVTAAHCLDAQFVSYEIVAPLAPNKPRVRATSPQSLSTSFEEVANPDIGFLTLDKPITLGHYAELTDVGPQIDAGEALSAAALVRTDELPEAPLQASQHVPVTSTLDLGYEHGFGTPMFTKGGDSGAGLFLVENGKMTHKLIGVARQPEPARNLDHFTRIDASFLTWYGEKTGTGD